MKGMGVQLDKVNYTIWLRILITKLLTLLAI